MSGRLDNDDARQHAAAVDFSLRELQKKVAEHEAELERVGDHSLGCNWTSADC